MGNEYEYEYDFDYDPDLSWMTAGGNWDIDVICRCRRSLAWGNLPQKDATDGFNVKQAENMSQGIEPMRKRPAVRKVSGTESFSLGPIGQSSPTSVDSFQTTPLAGEYIITFQSFGEGIKPVQTYGSHTFWLMCPWRRVVLQPYQVRHK